MAGLDRDLVKGLDLSRIAIAAEIQADGTLSPVGEDLNQVLAAARDRSWPRLHTVVVAQAQRLDGLDLVSRPQSPHLFSDPYTDFHVVAAGSIAEAMTQLALDAQTRWGRIDCALPPRDPNFVGRQQSKNQIREFIATHDGGYVIIVGGMGRGKGALLADLIHTAIAQGEQPIYHFAAPWAPNAGQPRNLAACLYARLKNKYALPEPHDWQWLDDQEKLERLLNQLADDGVAREILYLDGIDCADPVTQEPASIKGLNELPRGVFCVMTCRTPPKWLKTAQPVRVWDLDEYDGHRQDIRLYLEQQRERAHLPLSDELVDRIVTHPEPPVFFSITQRVREWIQARQELSRALADPNWWVTPPEELIAAEFQGLISDAQAQGYTQDRVWHTLGLIAVAREGMSSETLEAMGLGEQGMTERILSLAGSWMLVRTPQHQPSLPYRFDHPAYYHAMLAHLSAHEQADCHRALATACLNWKQLRGPARAYALRHGPAHWIACHSQDGLQQMHGDVEFNQVRMAAGFITEMAADLASASAWPALAEKSISLLIRTWETQSAESFWQQAHCALVQAFGSSSKWPTGLRTRLESSSHLPLVLFLADTLATEGMPSRALTLLEAKIAQAHEGDPAWAAARIALASLYDRCDRPDKAIQTLDLFIAEPGVRESNRPEYVSALYRRGILQHKTGRRESARETWGDIGRFAPRSHYAALALHQLGVLDLEQGDLVRAEAKFVLALNEQGDNAWNPHRAHDHRRLAQIYAQTGRTEKARIAFDKARAIFRRCGDRSHVRQTQQDIAAFLVCPYLQSNRPPVIKLGAMAHQFGIAESDLTFAFMRLCELNQSYLQVLDAESSLATGLAIPCEIVHAEGWWHAAVVVLLVDATGKIVWRKSRENASHGVWDASAGGHLAIGEDDLLAAARAVKEELGFVFAPQRFVRIGRRAEFKKIGAPEISRAHHVGPTEYEYKMDKTDRERISLFVAPISDDDLARFVRRERPLARALDWAGLDESVRAAQAEPGAFSSNFHLFAHPIMVARIARALRVLKAIP